MSDSTDAVATAQVLPAECCFACKFYLMSDGVCRRYPPQNVGGIDKKSQAIWATGFPRLQPNGWCGEFRPRNLV